MSASPANSEPPPGHAHAIENVGRGDLVTLFWSGRVFDEGHPDTIFLPVLGPGEPA